MKDTLKPYRDMDPKAKSVLFILSRSVSDFRMVLAATWLARWGYRVDVADVAYQYYGMQYDVIVCSRPHLAMCGLLQDFLDAGTKVIVDMDDDFYSIPETNPAYKTLGPGYPGYHTALKKLIARVTSLVTTTKEVAIRYGRVSEVINNYYDEENPLWGKKKNIPFSIGWIGTNTHREDFGMIKPALDKILVEYPETRIVIGNDDYIYNLFTEVPENRKLFYPGLPYEVYPAFYSDCSVMVVPLLDNHFNQAKSDIKLVEADAAGVDWIASPLPFYRAYHPTGLFAGKEWDWYYQLSWVIDGKYVDENKKQRVWERRSEVMAKKWKDLIDNI